MTFASRLFTNPTDEQAESSENKCSGCDSKNDCSTEQSGCGTLNPVGDPEEYCGEKL